MALLLFLRGQFALMASFESAGGTEASAGNGNGAAVDDSVVAVSSPEEEEKENAKTERLAAVAVVDRLNDVASLAREVAGRERRPQTHAHCVELLELALPLLEVTNSQLWWGAHLRGEEGRKRAANGEKEHSSDGAKAKKKPPPPRGWVLDPVERGRLNLKNIPHSTPQFVAHLSNFLPFMRGTFLADEWCGKRG